MRAEGERVAEWEHRHETYEDVLAAVVDYDEWLLLPIRNEDGSCPGCGAEWFGAINPFAFLYIYRCNGDDSHYPCGTLFRGREGHDYSDGLHAAEVFGAFIGHRRRYITGRKKAAPQPPLARDPEWPAQEC